MTRAVDLPEPARRLVARLIRTLQPELVVLFGSYACGKVTPESDVDLLIVVASELAAEELARRRAQLVSGILPRIDLVPATLDELSSARGERAAFLRGVLQQGVILHGDPVVRPDA